MTISPNQSGLNKIYLSAVKGLEELIDLSLKKGITRIPIPSEIECHEYANQILRKVERMYEDAGWIVEIKTEEADGPMTYSYKYFKFKIEKTKELEGAKE